LSQPTSGATISRINRLTGQRAGIPERLRALKSELAALDAVSPLYEVKVKPASIQGRRVRGPTLGGCGAMTRFLFYSLFEAKG